MRGRRSLFLVVAAVALAACDALIGLDAPDGATASSSASSSAAASTSSASITASSSAGGAPVTVTAVGSSGGSSSVSTGGPSGGAGGAFTTTSSTASSSTNVTVSSSSSLSTCETNPTTVCCETTDCNDKCCVSEAEPYTFYCSNICNGSTRHLRCDDSIDCGMGSVCGVKIDTVSGQLQGDIQCTATPSCLAPSCLVVCLRSMNGTCPAGTTCKAVPNETTHGVCE